MSIQRYVERQTASLTDSASTTEEIPFGAYAGGMIYVPTGSSITSLTFHAAPVKGGTYVPVYDSSNNAVTRTVGAARSYAIPDECFGAAAIKIVVNAAGNVDLTFKS